MGGGVTTVLYGAGSFYPGSGDAIGDVQRSGFTTVVAWALHVTCTGDLVYNEPVIVSGGSYVGDSLWPARLSTLKESGSVTRLLLSIGGWETGDFTHVQALIQAQGTGPGSALHDNFKALREALPCVDGIDLDNEDLYDESMTVELSRMLHALGFEVTFCPYERIPFWVDCLHSLNSRTPGLVSTFFLQCYAGGRDNNPQEWINAVAQRMGPEIDAESFIVPGLWCLHGEGCREGDCPDDMAARLAAWAACGIHGCFVWQYDDIRACTSQARCCPADAAAYAAAIVKGLAASS